MNNQPNEARKMLTIMLAFFFLLSMASFFLTRNQKPLTQKEKYAICPTCDLISGQR